MRELNLFLTPLTGDGAKPWIAAVVLIISVIVLVALFVFGRKGEKDKPDDEPTDEEVD